ncbi:MAG: tetratricopeptide repeat protein [Nibricoccus sp.]
MKPAQESQPAASPRNPSAKQIWIVGALLSAATLLAYSNSFRGPFVFDDVGAILNNPTIAKLWPPWDALVGPAGGSTASGRPLLNFALALNYVAGGFDVRGFHTVNLAIHVAAGLVLFGLIRRTLKLGGLRDRWQPTAVYIAGTSAALWLLHPLQTAAVTYIVQRAESLAGFFYLFSLYAFVRALSSPETRRWSVISFASCLCGMATKETAGSIPLFILLLDRTLVTGSFREALRKRRGYYIALASTWLLLAALVFSTHGRGGSVGADEKITSYSYALTQCKAIVHYLQLALWPSPLIFDYGTATIGTMGEVAWHAALILALGAATLYALWKRCPLGLLGAWFFCTLAPSSSVVPIVTQTIAEHRMYLALCGVVLVVTIAAFRWFYVRAIWLFFPLAMALAAATFVRNNTYASAVALWSDTAAKLPDSKRAHNNLGTALFSENRATEAIEAYQRAVRLDPRYVSALVNLARVQLQIGGREAENNFRAALAIDPDNAEAHFGVGFALAARNLLVEAVQHYQEAIRLDPTSTEYRLKLAQTLFRLNQPQAAINTFQAALTLSPHLPAAHAGLGTVLASQGNFAEARREFSEALRLDPNDFDAHFNLGNVLVEQEKVAEAVKHYEEAQRIRPGDPRVADILARAREYLSRSK